MHTIKYHLIKKNNSLILTFLIHVIRLFSFLEGQSLLNMFKHKTYGDRLINVSAIPIYSNTGFEGKFNQ